MFELRYINELSIDQIVKVTERSRATVNRDLEAAPKQLAGELGGAESDEKDEGEAEGAAAPKPQQYIISRWERRLDAGQRGVRLADDFDEPLPEFEGY